MNERTQTQADTVSATADALTPTGQAPLFTPPREGFLALRGSVTRGQTILYGFLGVVGLFLIWELAHLLTPVHQQKFVPSATQVTGKVIYLFTEKEFFGDVIKSVYRIYLSFFVACLVAVPIGVLMGSFIKMKALINPTVGGLRYLPAASFVPLLLVYFGPTDFAKMALLFLGCVFFLIALILDNIEAVPRALIESAQTMGAGRFHIVFKVTFRSAAPQILDSMRNMIAVSWTYLVIAEIVAATDGIGAVMMRGARFLHVDVIMGGILTIGILGVLTDITFRIAAHFLFPHTQARR